jgi:HK97 family phage prohead protease
MPELATRMETRDAAGEVSAVSAADRTFELRIATYGTVDTYGTVWEPGVFEDSLRTKLPPACWGHDWSRVIGSIREHDEREDGPYGLVQMADVDEVPDARMAYSLIKDKHITETSFGFKREEWLDAQRSDGYAPTLAGEKERMHRARLDEVSPVLVGSVPGARILAVRDQAGKVSRMEASRLVTAVATGQVSLREALTALESPDALRIDPPELEEEEEREEPPTDDDAEEIEIAEIDVRWAFELMEYDEMRVAGVATGNVTNPKGTAQLKEYWAHGKGALKVRWGTPGDHTRCVRLLSKYLPPNQVHGFCTNVQKLAIGHAGNPTAAEKGK